MGSLSARGRVLVVLAFVASAALFAGAAVAFVMATNDKNDDKKSTAIPTVAPTLVFPSESATPSPTASPTPSPTPAPTVTVTPTTAPSASGTPATSSPAPRRTTTPKPSPTGTVTAGLRTHSAFYYPTGKTTDFTYVITVHATDSNGTIYLKSVRWDNGAGSTLNERGAACAPAAAAPADCRDYRVTHKYTQPGSYIVEVTVVSGKETSIFHYNVTVDPAPSPSPSAS